MTKRDPYFKIVCVLEHTRPFLWPSMLIHMLGIFFFFIYKMLWLVFTDNLSKTRRSLETFFVNRTQTLSKVQNISSNISRNTLKTHWRLIIQWLQAKRLKDSWNRILFRKDWNLICVRTEGFTDLRPGITLKTRSLFISGNIVCDYMHVFRCINIFMAY